MRTTFSEVRLFNDNLFSTSDIFYIQRKGVGSSQARGREREIERERGGVWVEKSCGMGHKLGRETSYS